ncbi:M24 family metallopeptidase, partial [Candidatus Kaiserbacteria bacterium]|nr:M24 family metallopeptidase [Candidatus Kaiserbacteria bacterium]
PITFADGDVVSIDLVIGFEGMVVDSARTVGCGTLSHEAQALIDITAAALKAGIKAATAGARVKAIGAAIEAMVPKEYGIVEALCGHGVGYNVHEEPTVPNFVMKGDSPELESGMVIAIEPMIIAGSKDVIFDESDGYTVLSADGGLAAHMEHTVLITAKGPEVLTQGSKK